MTVINLSMDSQATLLLCSDLAIPKGMEREYKLFTLPEWNVLAKKLAHSSLRRPAALLSAEPEHLQSELAWNDDQVRRVVKLLSRRGSLAIELTQLEEKGIWVLTRSETTYPALFKKNLKDKAPMVIYGAGDISILDYPAIGIVGSRDASADALEFAGQLAHRCAREGVVVVSGGARGIDTISQEEALASGGQVISVMSSDLAAAIKKKQTRQLIMDNKLLIISPYHPQSRFTVGNAMGRNKLIYALAQFAVVASSAEGHGGTWTGAVENIKHIGVPTLVRDSEDISDGNLGLIKQGAIPINNSVLNESGSLLDILMNNTNRRVLQEESAGYNKGPETEKTNNNKSYDIFELVWPFIEQELLHSGECQTQQLAETMKIDNRQMSIWLNRAHDEGKLVKQGRPASYRLITGQEKDQSTLALPSLFAENNDVYKTTP